MFGSIHFNGWTELTKILLPLHLCFQGVFVYIALWHANIVVYVNEIAGGVLKGPLHTQGQFLSDGLLHSVTVEITSTDK